MDPIAAAFLWAALLIIWTYRRGWPYFVLGGVVFVGVYLLSQPDARTSYPWLQPSARPLCMGVAGLLVAGIIYRGARFAAAPPRSKGRIAGAVFGGMLALAVVLLVASIPSPRDRLRGKLPKAVMQCLQSPDSMTLFSIDPSRRNKSSEGTPAFHGHTVLGELKITSAQQQQIVAETIKDALWSWDGRSWLCFDPRHGLRITKGSESYDLLICFGCSAIYCYTGGERIAVAGIEGNRTALDRLLRAGDIPLADK